MTELEALKKVIEITGSQANLARACGYTQAAISRMLRTGRASATAAPLFEFAVQNAVTCYQLRPDLYQPPK